jgi:hypothetical protein
MEFLDMKTRLAGIAGLALGLTMLGGGVAAVSAHGSTAVPLSFTAAHAVGAGLSAPLYQLAPQDPACATQDQNQADGTEAADAAETDTVDLQCGDQTGADTGAADGTTEAAGAPEANNATGGDFGVDGVDQQQQGENAG